MRRQASLGGWRCHLEVAPAPLRYKRSRFSTRLPTGRLYTASHFWLTETEPGLWRVGFTQFATRMLGELVEHEFEVARNAPVQVGQIIGWLEGFKAITDLYCVLHGEFAGGNEALAADLTLIDSDPYGQGWLYAVRGAPDADALDVHGYVGVLDATIDQMLGVKPAGAQ